MLGKADQLRQPPWNLLVPSSHLKIWAESPPKRKLPRIFKPSMTSCANLLLRVVFRGLFQTPEDFSSVLGYQFPPFFPSHPLELKNTVFFPREKTVWPPTSRRWKISFQIIWGLTKYSTEDFICISSLVVFQENPAEKTNVWNHHLHWMPQKNRTSFQLLHPLGVLLPKKDICGRCQNDLLHKVHVNSTHKQMTKHSNTFNYHTCRSRKLYLSTSYSQQLSCCIKNHNL